MLNIFINLDGRLWQWQPCLVDTGGLDCSSCFRAKAKNRRQLFSFYFKYSREFQAATVSPATSTNLTFTLRTKTPLCPQTVSSSERTSAAESFQDCLLLSVSERGSRSDKHRPVYAKSSPTSGQSWLSLQGESITSVFFKSLRSSLESWPSSRDIFGSVQFLSLLLPGTYKHRVSGKLSQECEQRRAAVPKVAAPH